MLGSSLIGSNSSSPSKSRIFVYEITGLKQSETNDSNNYQIRNSGSIFRKVPYNRMNQEMQRINKMGGTIVNIQPLEDFQNQEAHPEHEHNDNSQE
ncbi:phycocyanin associated linker protein [Chondrocystis sp. NIES-4102]|nr:phycocyanin associated linker protein [Chondrocystis sp. NIES-4102]